MLLGGYGYQGATWIVEGSLTGPLHSSLHCTFEIQIKTIKKYTGKNLICT